LRSAKKGCRTRGQYQRETGEAFLDGASFGLAFLCHNLTLVKVSTLKNPPAIALLFFHPFHNRN